MSPGRHLCIPVPASQGKAAVRSVVAGITEDGGGGGGLSSVTSRRWSSAHTKYRM